jgi:colicin import membrane protein
LSVLQEKLTTLHASIGQTHTETKGIPTPPPFTGFSKRKAGEGSTAEKKKTREQTDSSGTPKSSEDRKGLFDQIQKRKPLKKVEISAEEQAVKKPSEGGDGGIEAVLRRAMDQRRIALKKGEDEEEEGEYEEDPAWLEESQPPVAKPVPAKEQKKTEPDKKTATKPVPPARPAPTVDAQAELKQKEEAAKLAQEKAEAALKAKADADRKAKEAVDRKAKAEAKKSEEERVEREAAAERERKEAARLAKEEAEKKKRGEELKRKEDVDRKEKEAVARKAKAEVELKEAQELNVKIEALKTKIDEASKKKSTGKSTKSQLFEDILKRFTGTEKNYILQDKDSLIQWVKNSEIETAINQLADHNHKRTLEKLKNSLVELQKKLVIGMKTAEAEFVAADAAGKEAQAELAAASKETKVVDEQKTAAPAAAQAVEQPAPAEVPAKETQKLIANIDVLLKAINTGLALTKFSAVKTLGAQAKTIISKIFNPDDATLKTWVENVDSTKAAIEQLAKPGNYRSNLTSLQSSLAKYKETLQEQPSSAAAPEKPKHVPIAAQPKPEEESELSKSRRKVLKIKTPKENVDELNKWDSFNKPLPITTTIDELPKILNLITDQEFIKQIKRFATGRLGLGKKITQSEAELLKIIQNYEQPKSQPSVKKK